MGSCAAPSAKGDDKFITTDYLQQCRVDYISGQDQKWWPAAAGIAAYGSNHAGFTVWLKVIFLLNIVR
uniref:hypothetical protein n=1 Tax=Escherichia coli TaxID=562 RepID=UPI0015EF320B|nr:hypothetical protein [Escherichia coli]